MWSFVIVLDLAVRIMTLIHNKNINVATKRSAKRITENIFSWFLNF